MYNKEYNFKYSDLDSNGNIKISTIMDLLQDVSIFHSDHVGYGFDRMKQMSLAMLLHGWRIKLFEPLRRDIPAVVETGIMNIKRCDVYRRYEIRQGGRIIGMATADWFSFDIHKRTIIRVPEEINSGYESVSEPDNGFPVVKLRSCTDMSEAGQMTVTRRDLDTNNHMNNVKSVEVAFDYIPENFEYSEIQVVYNKEIQKDDVIKIFTSESEDSFVVELRNENGDSCVIVKVA